MSDDAADSSMYKILKFNGETGKFHDWRQNVRIVFRARNWMRFIDPDEADAAAAAVSKMAPARSRMSFGVKQEPQDSDDEASEKEKSKRAKQEEEEKQRLKNYREASVTDRREYDKAFAALWSSLGPAVRQLFDPILPEGDVLAWYTSISKQYGKTSIHDCAQLMTEILSAKCSANDDVDSFVSSMLRKQQSLVSAKNGFTELQLKVFITRALPDEYAPVITALKYADQLQLRSIEDITAMLKSHQHEVIRSGSASSATAHFASNRNNNKYQNNRNKHHPNTNGSNGASAQTHTQGTTTCFRCGGYNHLSTDCRTAAEKLHCNVTGCNKQKGDHSTRAHHARTASRRGAQQQAAPNTAATPTAQHTTPTSTANHTLVAYDTTLAASVSAVDDNGKVAFVTDSGASTHFVHDIRLLRDPRQCEEITVHTADGRQYKSDIIGSCPLILPNGETLEITNTRYCKGLTVNLLSVTQMLNGGATVSFSSDDGGPHALITTGTGSTIKVPSSGNLFILRCSSQLSEYTNAVIPSSSSAAPGGAAVHFVYGTTSDPTTDGRHHHVNIVHLTVDIAMGEAASAGALAVVDTDTWHQRFGHLSKSGMTKLIKSGSVVGLNITADQSEQLAQCAHCEIAKAKHRSFADHKYSHATAPMHHISADLCSVKDDSRPDGRHLLVLVDTYTRMKFVRILDRKSDAEQQIIDFITIEQRQTGNMLKVFHSDGGGEFISTHFKKWLSDHGIQKTTTLTATPAHNAIVERANRSLLEKVRAMMLHAKSPEIFWPYAARYAAYVLNRSLTKGTTEQGVTPYQLWFGHSPAVDHLRVLYCDCFIYDESPTNTKLSGRATRGFFIGIDESRNDYRAYQCWDIEKDKLVTSRNVTFSEKSFAHVADYKRTNSIEDSDDYILFDVDQLTETEIELAKIISLEHQPTSQPDDDQKYSEPPLPNTITAPLVKPAKHNYKTDGNVTVDRILPDNIKRSRAQTNFSYKINPRDVGYTAIFHNDLQSIHRDNYSTGGIMHHAFALTDMSLSDPSTYREAMNSRNASHWTAAMQSEYQSMIDNDVFEEVDPPNGAHIMGSRFVYKTKIKSTGAIDKYKARLVAQGFTQTPEEYGETYAPTLRLDTLRILLAIGVKLNYALKQMDVCTAFLNAPLKETIYMRPPEGLPITRGKVLHLLRSIYGLKQSPHEWHQLLTDYLRSLDWSQSKSDPCLFYKISKSNHVMYIGIFVDDLLSGYNIQLDSAEYDAFKSAFTQRFKTTDIGDVDWILGMKAERNFTNGTLFLHQQLYTEKVLKTFHMDTCKSVSSPEDANIKLSRDDCPSPSDDDYDAHIDEMHRTPYAAVVGSLLYLSICTRPDIAHSVHVLTRFMQNPGRAHWQYAKRVMRYLRGTTNYGLLFNRNNSSAIVASSTAHSATHAKYAKSQQNPGTFRDFPSTATNDIATTGDDLGISSMSDANYGSDRVISATDTNYKSTTGSLFYVGGNLIAWDSFLQPNVAQSTCEAEYMAACQTANKTMAITHLLDELEFDASSTPAIIYVDNQAAISIANSVYSGRSVRHIAIPWHVLKDYVHNKQVELQWISTKSQLADIMTKAMKPDAFIPLRDQLVTKQQ